MGASVGIANLSAFYNSVEKAKTKVKGTITERYKEFVAKVLKDLAMNTPQWSGDLAASWQVVVGAGASPADLGKTPFKKYHYRSVNPIRQMGNNVAVSYTQHHNEFIIESIRWNSKVQIVNVNPTLGKMKVERLRGVNRPKIPGDYMGLAYVAAKYSKNYRQLQGFGT